MPDTNGKANRNESLKMIQEHDSNDSFRSDASESPRNKKSNLFSGFYPK